MKFNWNEMSTAQKVEAIVLTVLAVIASIFAILELTGKWPNNLAYLIIAAGSVFEAVMSWNKNRKMALLELVAAAFFVSNAFLG